MDKNRLNGRVLVLGASGMVGSAVLKELINKEYPFIFAPKSRSTGSVAAPDLRIYSETKRYITHINPDYVFLCAATAGGIKANSEKPVDFLQDNLRIQSNVLEICAWAQVKRVIFLGSSCIYPKLAPQPLKEQYLLTGPLEPSNKAYALAKIAGIELCRAYNGQHGTDFISVMPCNLYGDNDKYGDTGHVIPMLLEKFHKAKQDMHQTVTAWGTGNPYREFMHASDLANCLVQLMSVKTNLPDLINVGTSEEVRLSYLVKIIQHIVGHRGAIQWDETMPDGTPRKVLDCSLLREILPEWAPKIDLKEGIARMYEDYKQRYGNK